MAALKGRDLLSLADLNTLEVQLLHLAAQLKAGVLNCGAKFWGFCSTKLRLGRVSVSP